MIPSHSQMMLPLLKMAEDENDVDTFQAEKILGKQFNLTQREKTIIKNSGKERLFLNKLRWAKTHLRMAGLIKYTLKNWYSITKEGLEFLKTNPIKITEKTLYQFKDYLEQRLKIVFEYRWCMANKWTFKIKPVREFLEREIKGISIDPSCGQSDFAEIRNDINPNSKAQCNMESIDFLKKIKSNYADTILLDFPYSPFQYKTSYEDMKLKPKKYHTHSYIYSRIKNEAARIIKKGGIAISFGWNSTGLGKKRGFQKRKILLVCHGGQHNDTIVTLEEKI